ncbi:MAG: AsmA-like C-terminal region-containing protein [Bryobacteraceae bacterium]|jgi:hypothetical protein
MTAGKRNWIIAIGLAAILIAGGLAVSASRLSGRIEPYARQAAIGYLSQRFASDVELQALHLRVPGISPLRLILTRGRGVSVRVEGQGLRMWLKGRPGALPLFAIRKFQCEVDLESLLHPPVAVREVSVDGMEIDILPPAGGPGRPAPSADTGPARGQSASNLGVAIGKVSIRHAALVLQPKNPQRVPLRFDIERLELESGGAGAPMKYDASLTNAKPPGKVRATGTFGPWRADEPGDTPLTGDYVFEKADLGVFAGIAGTLESSGRFEGKLSAITTHGQASVPNFRLRMTGTAVPLFARFAVLVDGTNGNTVLQPVAARLGTTEFTTSGGIIRHEANQPRAVTLNVAMPNGDLRDILRLAMKGTPFMEGRLVLNAKIDIPPLTGKMREKLDMDGTFEVEEGKFLHSTIQNQIDGLSRRARGLPRNPDGDQALSHMAGVFHLENAAMRFEKLSFGFPGTNIDLAGGYNLDSDILNFGGTLKLQATVSQMVTGWKRLVLRPVDPFFEKGGAGTFLRIRVEGTSKAPKFGVNLAGRQLELPLPKR